MTDYLLSLIYPRRCPICRDIAMPKGSIICPECTEGLPYIKGPFCYRCGRHLESEEIEYCYECSNKAFSYTSGRAVFEYTGAVRQAVLDFKYNSYRDNCDFFVQEMYEKLGPWIRDMAPDILVPVPVHRSRKRFRGYNQAELLAAGLAEKTGIPLEKKLLRRSRKTLPQKQLNFEQRSRNLSKAFSADEENLNLIKQKLNRDCIDVMLVDDIYTTGSTIEACSRCLLAAGVNRVSFVSVCSGAGIV